MVDPVPVPESQTDSDAAPAPGIEARSFNTPVDDPHHYDFQEADVPMDPDEETPPGHRQHEGGYTLNS